METTSLNRQEIQGLAAELAVMRSEVPDVEAGHVVGLIYSGVKIKMENKSRLTSDEFSQIARSVIDEIMLPEYTRIYIKDGMNPAERTAVDKKISGFLLVLQSRFEGHFADYVANLSKVARG